MATKTRFAIVTPTIGRRDLWRCVQSLQSQVFKDYRQIIVGDGPQSDDVKKFVSTVSEAVYLETPKQTKNFGCEQRNVALQAIEDEYPADYVLFLDDDNVLLESALYNIHWTAVNNVQPPLMYQTVCFINKFITKYILFPSAMPPEQAKWDGMNGIYRSDVVRGLRWVPGYAHDFFFTQAAITKAGSPFIEVEGINGIHHLSWDTYALNMEQNAGV